MTRYTVEWNPDVEANYMDAWIAGDSTTRTSLTEIADWLDRNLAVAPERKGKFRSDIGARVVAIPTSNLTIRASAIYQVFTDDRRVVVSCLILYGL